MLVTSREILRMIHNNPKSTFDFPLYSSLAEMGVNPTDTMSRRTYLPAGSLTARTVDEAGNIVASMLIDKLVMSLWESFAQFAMNGEVVCKRSGYGQPMISKKDELFLQSPIEQLIEDDLMASKTGREVIMPDLSEGDAASLMQGFKNWRENGGK